MMPTNQGLCSQHPHRVDAHRMPGRAAAGGERHGEDRAGRADQHPRVGCRNPVEHAGDRARQQQGAGQAQENPHGAHDRGSGRNVTQEIGGVRAHGHPYRELAGPPRDEVRRDAVDADGRQGQGQGCEYPD